MLLSGEDLEVMVCLLTRVMDMRQGCPIALEAAGSLRHKFETELDHHAGPSRWAVHVDTVDTTGRGMA